nr:RHS repeat-associated core domain-containing protein [uncultured Pseudomonas sp.]
MKKNFFYSNLKKIDPVLTQGTTRKFLFGDYPIAELNTRDDSITTLILMTDGSETIMNTKNRHAAITAYTAYGYDDTDDSPSHSIAFNGQLLINSIKGYLLGQGKRLYSPTLMRFFSPDRYSPFEIGGINAYCYCTNDPINKSDPSGHAGLRSFVPNDRARARVRGHSAQPGPTRRLPQLNAHLVETNYFYERQPASNPTVRDPYEPPSSFKHIDKIHMSDRYSSTPSAPLEDYSPSAPRIANVLDQEKEEYVLALQNRIALIRSNRQKPDYPWLEHDDKIIAQYGNEIHNILLVPGYKPLQKNIEAIRR